MTGRTIAAVLLLVVVGLGCGDDEPANPRKSHVEAAHEARADAYELLDAGRDQASRETFRRAYFEARHALAAEATGEGEGEYGRPDILNLLSALSWELGRWEPNSLGKAVRYARRAMDEGPGWGAPWLNLALAFQHAGLPLEALNAYDEYFRIQPGDQVPLIAPLNRLKVHYLLALDILCADHVGAEGDARRVLERGFALEPDPAKNPDVHLKLSEINARHQEEYRQAAEAQDGLEIIRIRARYGWMSPASDALTKVRNQVGRTQEVRWVEVRFVEELDRGNTEALEKAVEHYLEFLQAGNRVLHAAAGYGRVMLQLDRGEEALARIGGYDEPTVELRRVLIQLRLDRLRRLIAKGDEAGGEAADAEYDRILKLLEGSLLDWDRSRAYWDLALAMLVREDLDRLEEVIRRYRKRFPADGRTVIMEAELLEKRGIPIEEGGK